MDAKSCSSHAAVKTGCSHKQGCSSASAETNIGNVVIWIVALDADTVHLFLQRPGQSIEPLSMGCCCSKEASSPESLAKYLDTALACGHYTGLVLVGSETALKTIKRLLSPAVHNRVIAEIIDDIAGKNTHEVAQSIAARMTL
jgi:hypothetical protein